MGVSIHWTGRVDWTTGLEYWTLIFLLQTTLSCNKNNYYKTTPILITIYGPTHGDLDGDYNNVIKIIIIKPRPF